MGHVAGRKRRVTRPAERKVPGPALRTLVGYVRKPPDVDSYNYCAIWRL